MYSVYNLLCLVVQQGRATLRSALVRDITQDIVVLLYRLFGTTYRSHLQGFLFFLDSIPLKMEPIVCPDTSVHNYHYTLRHFPEERRSQLINDESLKSLKSDFVHIMNA
jgi:hypothetical protein